MHPAESGKLAARQKLVKIAEAFRRELAGIAPACIQFISSTQVHAIVIPPVQLHFEGT